LLEAPIPGLKDSKKLSKLQRTKLDLVIRDKAVAFGLGWVTAQEVDSLGLTEAVRLAMQRAVDAIQAPYDEIIIDGHINFLPDYPRSSCLIKADDLIPAVSAASIIAKVARDTYMAGIATEYPGYLFESHVGYGTKHHSDALRLLGLTPLHRRSFAPIRAML
jgi:ribonuclease HII